MAYVVPFEVPVWRYERALGELRNALRFGIEPLLETVEDLLVELGNPDLAFSAVQIAGTNGKTSTSRYTAAILRGEGLRTGLYTSPELVRYNERIEVDGAPVDDDSFARGIAAALTAGERVNAKRRGRGEKPINVTEFDTLTVAACVIFAEAGIDVAVFEVGMGGRWDATTAVKSIRTVAVTGIGLDHMHILGDTLEAIASEKAAVIKPDVRCVLGCGVATPASVEDVFLDRCAQVGVEPTLVRPTRAEDASGVMCVEGLRQHDELPLVSFEVVRRPGHLGGSLCLDVHTTRADYENLSALKPAYQTANIALGVALAEEHLGRGLAYDALCTSVATCPTPGRFDLVRTEPIGLMDACHNPQSVEVFLGSIREVFPERDERPALLAAVLSDKDVDGIVALLAAEFERVHVTQTTSPRALPAADLAAKFIACGRSVLGVHPTVHEALAALANEPFVACGSITLAGEVAALHNTVTKPTVGFVTVG